MKLNKMVTTETYSPTSLHKLSAALLISLGLFAAGTQAATVSGNMGYVSDYLFRGISQTDEGMAIQGGLTLTDESGLYLSTWGSNIDFGEGSMELDIMAGWTGQLSEDWTTDIGIMQYRYPNGDNDTDQFNFYEVYSKFIYQNWTLGVAYTNDYFGTDVDQYSYYSIDYSYPIIEDFKILMHISYNKFENNTQYATFLAAGPVTGHAYMDWSFGVATSMLGVDMQLKYADTDIDSSAECNLCDGRAVFSLSKAF